VEKTTLLLRHFLLARGDEIMKPSECSEKMIPRRIAFETFITVLFLHTYELRKTASTPR